MDWEPSRRENSPSPSRLGNLHRRGQADPGSRVNDTHGDQNCYFTTAAALSGSNTSGLVGRTETMQQNSANPTEINDLFRDSGLDTHNTSFMDSGSARHRMDRFADGDEFALAYRRHDGSGHVVAGDRHNGRTSLYDFQNDTRVSGSGIDDFMRRENINDAAFLDVKNTRHSARMDLDDWD